MYGKDRSGIARPSLMDSEGKVIIAPGSGKYADAAINGRLFCAAMQTPATTSTTLNTTFVGLGLCNPTGSGKIILVHEFSYSITASATAEALLALGTTTDNGFTTDIVPRCCRFNYASSVAIVDRSATITAPVLERIITTFEDGAFALGALPNAPCVVELGGSIILEPGRAVVTDTTVALGAVAQFGFMWEEIDS
jgi:hypothetical protein